MSERRDLTGEEVTSAFEEIARGDANGEQVAALLCLLRSKGETAEEVGAIVSVMLRHAVPAKVEGELLDIVGTGGDGHDTLNYSTAAAVLCAASGARVCKHGNRSVSSRSGSADVLETLGVALLPPDAIAECVDRCGIAFMFAPHFHPAMKHVVPVRKALGVRTVFNILGPLLNPARAQRLMLGVYSPALLDLYGHVLHRLGVRHALVVHCCGLDELAPLGQAEAVEVTPDAGVRRLTVDAAAIAGARCSIEDLKGGDAAHNAAALREIFAGGEAAAGPHGQTISLNAGAALYVCGRAASIEEGYHLAMDTLRSGAALKVLDAWAATSTELAQRASGSH